MLERLFHLRAHDTTVRTEVLGGATTFVTMAYIMVVNPAILSFAGIPVGPSTVATIVVAVFGTLLMGLYANRPIGVAPYMGENAFIAFGLAALGITWEQRLGAVFVSGIGFLAITLLGVRAWLADSISPSLKYSFAAGIGLFLALIGLYETGIVTSGAAGAPAESLLLPDQVHLRAPDVPLKIGNLRSPEVLLAVGGLVLIVVLMARRVRGGIIVGIGLTALAGMVLGKAEPPAALVALPFRGEYSLAPIALHLDVAGVLRFCFLPLLLTLFLMGFLDTLGTLMGVGAAGGMLDEKGRFPALGRPMLVDATACILSGLVGTSTSGAYIESAVGIREGARTGLAAVVTALLFALSLFFIPLLTPLQGLRYAYAPALVAVGMLMLSSVARIDFSDLTEVVPAFLTIALMVFTYNIANGLTVGLLLHPVIKVLGGKRREVSRGSVVLAALCALYFVFGMPH